MSHPKPFVLSIAGFDPSGGAGILADIKTFEMHHAYGLGACTSITFQNENEFDGLEWVRFISMQKQLEVLFRKYKIEVIKIGLVESFIVLNRLLEALLKLNPGATIIWDPIMKASAGFDFHPDADQSLLNEILNKLSLVTPNLPEAVRLVNKGDDPVACAIDLTRHCNVYLKGGHNMTNDVDDFLFTPSARYRMEGKRIAHGEKHGSGCVLSAAIAANLANGMSLKTSCEEAKIYMNRFLQSSKRLLGYHYSEPFYH
jgi:hydroxymethylpyrimidine/phosphomethylpyrimidine kinase